MQARKLILFIVPFVILLSCKKTPQEPVINKQVGKGLFIVNQGNFMFSNSSLSYYNPVTGEVQNKVFQKINNIPLGDVAQSMIINDSVGFVVLNNSGRVYVIDINTFEYKGWINGLTSPRYIKIINKTKGYITDLYARAITVFNPETLEITGYIPTNNGNRAFNQHSTEQMVRINNRIYTNCWSFDDKVLVIDTERDVVVDSITIGIQPVAIQKDKNDYLWVLTDGGYQGNSFGYENPKLVCMNVKNKSIIREFSFKLTDRPTDLQINAARDTLYLLNNDVWKLAVDQENFPTVPFVKHGQRLFYAIGVDPSTSEVYISDAIDYMQPGLVFRYTPQGQPIDTLRVGIVPGAICFK